MSNKATAYAIYAPREVTGLWTAFTYISENLEYVTGRAAWLNEANKTDAFEVVYSTGRAWKSLETDLFRI